ncbi:hypothetical protein [Neptuniibacter sp. QD37_11]|uniref:hypothetical protein n=1 Tax=Neptuniibacter sp. QD37_11 TaxID=3398209 RepID=UPI0039F62F82
MNSTALNHFTNGATGSLYRDALAGDVDARYFYSLGKLLLANDERAVQDGLEWIVMQTATHVPSRILQASTVLNQQALFSDKEIEAALGTLIQLAPENSTSALALINYTTSKLMSACKLCDEDTCLIKSALNNPCSNIRAAGISLLLRAASLWSCKSSSTMLQASKGMLVDVAMQNDVIAEDLSKFNRKACLIPEAEVVKIAGHHLNEGSFRMANIVIGSDMFPRESLHHIRAKKILQML